MTVRFLTTKQAAKMLGLDISRVRCFCEEGRLGQKIGRNWAITESELEKFKTIPRTPGRRWPKTRGS